MALSAILLKNPYNAIGDPETIQAGYKNCILCTTNSMQLHLQLPYRFTADLKEEKKNQTNSILLLSFFYTISFVVHSTPNVFLCLSKEINTIIFIMYFGGRVNVGFCVIWPGNMIHDEKKYQPWIWLVFFTLPVSLSKSEVVVTIRWLYENCRFQAVSKTEERKKRIRI